MVRWRAKQETMAEVIAQGGERQNLKPCMEMQAEGRYRQVK